MNPAFSVIFFTTLSGAGYGLMLFWIGIFTAGTFFSPAFPLSTWFWINPWFDALVASLGLVTIGLSSSVLHLGKPLRAWRAFSQWRTSWLSREGVFSILVYAGIGLFFASFVLEGVFSRIAGEFALALIATCSVATIVCTGMIYASLKPIPAWRHRLVVPVYLAFALATGGWIGAALFTTKDEPTAVRMTVFALLGSVTLMLVAMKIAYWRAIDHIVMPSREAATALEGIGKVTVFERPHTEANYLTREMGFVLARKHSRKLRLIAVVLFAAIPMLALFAAYLFPAAASFALWFAAVGALLGAFVERWLFFAEAKHMVMLYY